MLILDTDHMTLLERADDPLGVRLRARLAKLGPDVMTFDEPAAVAFQSLKKGKIRIGTMDLKIAAIALAHQATLLTRNFGDFHKVPGLKIEDWTKE